MRLSDHFSTETDPNLECYCGCGFGSIIHHWNPKLAEIAEAVRGAAGRPLLVTSGCRCPRHNREVPGSARHSLHMSGDALDIACPADLTVEQLYTVADHALRLNAPAAGLGQYPTRNFIHVDTGRGRPPGRRWTL